MNKSINLLVDAWTNDLGDDERRQFQLKFVILTSPLLWLSEWGPVFCFIYGSLGKITCSENRTIVRISFYITHIVVHPSLEWAHPGFLITLGPSVVGGVNISEVYFIISLPLK